jgi:amino acid permease
MKADFLKGMRMKNKKLTFIESLALVAGAGIGTGILTIPYAIDKIGIWGTLSALALAYFVSAIMYFMIADLVRNSKESNDLLSILEEHLFGNRNKILHILFLILLVLLLLENLVVYILCASQVIVDLLGIASSASMIIFYLISSIIVLLGIKGVGICEKISLWLIGAAVIILTILSLLNPRNSLELSFGEPDVVFAVYGLFMFAFSAIFSIIQVCNHIEKPHQAGKAILGGLTVNGSITMLFSIATIIGSETVAEIATIGLAEGTGIPFVRILCSFLVLLAMFTSFWSSGIAFSQVIENQLRCGEKTSWLIATAPAVIISVFIPLTVLDYVQIGAGALSVILVIVVLPAYHHSIKNCLSPLLPRKIAQSRFLLCIMAFAIILMALSSFVPLD